MTGSHENSDFVIFVTHVEADESYLKIWGQVDKNAATCVEQMILPLVEQFTRGQGTPGPQSKNLTVNALCCARFQEEGYYRAKVLHIYANHTALLKFIDYGNIEVLPIQEIHLLDSIPGSESLQSLPPMAHEFVLSNVYPVNGVWDGKVIESIKKTLWYNEYKASLCSSMGNQHLIKLWFNNEDFAEVLVKKHMAIGMTSQDVLRSKYMQPTPMHIHQKPRSIMSNTNHTNMLCSEINSSQGPEDESQALWKNIPHLKHISSVYIPQKNSVLHQAPVHEALVFKSQVLDIGSKHNVRISYVEDGPQMFSIQTQSTSKTLNELMRDINNSTTNPLQEPPLPGSVCLGRYTQDKTLCRAVVMSVMENKCKLYYVDFGHTEVLPYTDIFQLPPQYINPKVLSIRFTMSGVKELNITHEMKEYFQKIVLGKILTLHVNRPEGPPLIQYGDLYDNGHNVKDILQQAFSIPIITPMGLQSLVMYPSPRLLTKGMQEIVHVSFVLSCKKFFVQLDSDAKCLESIMACLAEDTKIAAVPKLAKLKIGLPCAALYNGQWYRAQILDINGDKIKIFYVDYGNEETVTVTSLRVIHENLVTKLQAQAIRCSWNYCETLQINETISNQFESLILEKCLYMKVIDARPDGVHVDLYDPQRRESIESQLSRLLSLEKGASIGSTLFFTPACDSLQSKILDDTKEQHYNENWSLELNDNISQENCKSSTWKDNIRDEKYYTYETRLPQYDDENHERAKKGCTWQDSCTKQELFVKHSKSGAIMRHKTDKDARSYRSRLDGNDSKFCRNSGSDKSGSDKDSDMSSRGSGRQGRMDSRNNFIKCDNITGKVYGSKWNDKRYDKSGCKNGKPCDKACHTLGKQKLKDQKIQTGAVVRKKKHIGESCNSVSNDLSYASDTIPGSSNKFQIPHANIIIGSVKNCEIVFISSSSDFFVQISPDYMELESIMQRIQRTYENSNDTMPSKEIVPGAYCITQYTADLKWYRAMVTSVEETGAIVAFVDYGNTELVAFSKIKRIYGEFVKLPAQAIHCKLLAVFEIETNSFSDKVDGKVFEAEFVVKRDNTYEILLREIIKGLPSLNYLNEEFCAKADLYKAKRDAIDHKSNRSTWMTTDTDYVTDDYKWSATVYKPNAKDDVIVTWFINPNNFYCQARSKETDFRVMMNKIQKIYASRQPAKHTLKVGSPVVALFSDDGVLYRAEILESNKSHGYLVQYIDFGNCAVVSESNVYGVEKELTQLPKLAIHCTLKNIGPMDSSWTKGSENAIDSCFNADKYEGIFHHFDDDKYIVTLTVNDQSVGDILVKSKLALYNNLDVITNENVAQATPKPSTDYQTLNLNRLSGQTIRTKVICVENMCTFYVLLCPATIENEDINDTSAASVTLQNQMLRCRLQDEEVSEAASKQLQSFINGPEIIIYIEEVDCDRVVVSLYDASGSRLIPEGPDTICPICPMPIFHAVHKVSVTYATDSCNVWLQRPSDYEEAQHLRQALYKYYSNSSKRMIEPTINQLCVVQNADGYWYRGKIMKCTKSDAHVTLIDYGNIEEVPLERLMQLDVQFYVPHELAVNVSLNATLTGTDLQQSNILHCYLAGKLLTAEFSRDNQRWIVDLFENGEELKDKLNSLTSARTININSLIGCSNGNGMVEGNAYDVCMSHADSPSQFWLQCVGETLELAEKQTELQANACTYSNVEGILEEGALCAAVYSIDGMWYRAEVLDADEDITTVRFIDYGNTDIIDNRSGSIKHLPDSWKALKEYSIKCKLNRVIPIDVEDWNENACERFRNLITSAKSLQAVPIKSGKPMQVDLFINEKSVSEILVEEHIAIMTHPNEELIDEIVDLELDPHSAFVSHIDSPSEFWVQEEKSVADLEILTDRFIVADMFPKIDEVTEGLLCVAKYPDDESWYRARVISHTENGTQVIYIDYGNSAVSTDIRVIPEDLINIPPLSRKCCLELPEGVKKWSDKACGKFISLAADGATIFLLDVLQEGETSIVNLSLENENVTDILAALCDRQLPGSVEERLSPLGEESTADVLVSHIDTLNDFWVQIKNCVMQNGILLSRLESASDFPQLIDLKIGILCAARNSHTSQWQRARILSYENSYAHVFYIDYGNSSHTNQLKMLSMDLQDIPVLCKRCSLQLPDHLKSWPEEAGKTFKQLADDATIFQCETLDNEDPAHVRLLYHGNDVIDTILRFCENSNGNQSSGNEAIGTNMISESDRYEQPSINKNQGTVDAKFCTKHILESVETNGYNHQRDTRLTSKIISNPGNNHSVDTESTEEPTVRNSATLEQSVEGKETIKESQESDLVINICKGSVLKGQEIMSHDVVSCNCVLNQSACNDPATIKQSMCLNLQDKRAQNMIRSNSDEKMGGNITESSIKEQCSNDTNSVAGNANSQCELRHPINLKMAHIETEGMLTENSNLVNVPRATETLSFHAEEFETISIETHASSTHLQEEAAEVDTTNNTHLKI